MAKQEDIVIRPQAGFQEKFTQSTADVVFGVGQLGSGKSYALILAMAEALMLDGDFRSLISRRQISNLKMGGGFVEKFKQIFGSYCHIKESDNPRVSFPSGAYCDLTYIDDSDMKRLTERAKGWEYDVIAIDELTELSWEGFSYVMTRNRGISKTFTGHFFATLNPKRSHWTRQFLDWYIDAQGNVIPEREGCVRYFYVTGASVRDVVWGDSKEEVYRKCKIDIDRKLKAIGGNFSYKNLIKSFVFYLGRMSENVKLAQGNSDYVGSAVAVGGAMAQALVEANFNVDPEDEYNAPIPSFKARECFTNDPAVNGEKWITVDLADYGTDNMLALAFNGCHCYDILIRNHTTPAENASNVRAFAQKLGIPENHIIYDGTAGRYFNDYVPDAIPFLSASRGIGLYALTAATMKDMCAMRLVKMINRGQFTFSEEVAHTIYKHQLLKFPITVETEFIEECAVVRFRDLPSGKKRLYSKKEMNDKLGKGRSMDLFDPCNMLMMHYCNIEYGQEIQSGFAAVREEEEEMEEIGIHNSIYDNTLWA
jgi:hypothetical protein